MKKLISLILCIAFTLTFVGKAEPLCTLLFPTTSMGMCDTKPYDFPRTEGEADPEGPVEFNCGSATKLSRYGEGVVPSKDWVAKDVDDIQYEDRSRLKEMGFDILRKSKREIISEIAPLTLRVSADGRLWASAVADEADCQILLIVYFTDGTFAYLCEFVNPAYPCKNPICWVHLYGERWPTKKTDTSTDTTPKPTTKPTAQPTAKPTQKPTASPTPSPTPTPTPTPTPSPTTTPNGDGTAHSSTSYGDWTWNGSSWTQGSGNEAGHTDEDNSGNGTGTEHSTPEVSGWEWNGTSWVRTGSGDGTGHS